MELVNKSEINTFQDIYVLPFTMWDKIGWVYDSNDNFCFQMEALYETLEPEDCGEFLKIINNSVDKKPYKNKDIEFKASKRFQEIYYRNSVDDEWRKYIFDKLIKHKTYGE